MGCPGMRPCMPHLMKHTPSSGSRQNTLVIPKTSERTSALPWWCMTRRFLQEPEKGSLLSARAYQLTDSRECSHAFACLRSLGWEHPPSVDMVVGATLRGVYKAVPENIWISTEDSNGLDGRVQVDVLEM